MYKEWRTIPHILVLGPGQYKPILGTFLIMQYQFGH